MSKLNHYSHHLNQFLSNKKNKSLSLSLASSSLSYRENEYALISPINNNQHHPINSNIVNDIMEKYDQKVHDIKSSSSLSLFHLHNNSQLIDRMNNDNIGLTIATTTTTNTTITTNGIGAGTGSILITPKSTNNTGPSTSICNAIITPKNNNNNPVMSNHESKILIQDFEDNNQKDMHTIYDNHHCKRCGKHGLYDKNGVYKQKQFEFDNPNNPNNKILKEDIIMTPNSLNSNNTSRKTLFEACDLQEKLYKNNVHATNNNNNTNVNTTSNTTYTNNIRSSNTSSSNKKNITIDTTFVYNKDMVRLENENTNPNINNNSMSPSIKVSDILGFDKNGNSSISPRSNNIKQYKMTKSPMKSKSPNTYEDVQMSIITSNPSKIDELTPDISRKRLEKAITNEIPIVIEGGLERINDNGNNIDTVHNIIKCIKHKKHNIAYICTKEHCGEFLCSQCIAQHQNSKHMGIYQKIQEFLWSYKGELENDQVKYKQGINKINEYIQILRSCISNGNSHYNANNLNIMIDTIEDNLIKNIREYFNILRSDLNLNYGYNTLENDVEKLISELEAYKQKLKENLYGLDKDLETYCDDIKKDNIYHIVNVYKQHCLTSFKDNIHKIQYYDEQVKSLLENMNHLKQKNNYDCRYIPNLSHNNILLLHIDPNITNKLYELLNTSIYTYNKKNSNIRDNNNENSLITIHEKLSEQHSYSSLNNSERLSVYTTNTNKNEELLLYYQNLYQHNLKLANNQSEQQQQHDKSGINNSENKDIMNSGDKDSGTNDDKDRVNENKISGNDEKDIDNGDRDMANDDNRDRVSSGDTDKASDSNRDRDMANGGDRDMANGNDKDMASVSDRDRDRASGGDKDMVNYGDRDRPSSGDRSRANGSDRAMASHGDKDRVSDSNSNRDMASGYDKYACNDNKDIVNDDKVCICSNNKDTINNEKDTSTSDKAIHCLSGDNTNTYDNNPYSLNINKHLLTEKKNQEDPTTTATRGIKLNTPTNSNSNNNISMKKKYHHHQTASLSSQNIPINQYQLALSRRDTNQTTQNTHLKRAKTISPRKEIKSLEQVYQSQAFEKIPKDALFFTNDKDLDPIKMRIVLMGLCDHFKSQKIKVFDPNFVPNMLNLKEIACLDELENSQIHYENIKDQLTIRSSSNINNTTTITTPNNNNSKPKCIFQVYEKLFFPIYITNHQWILIETKTILKTITIYDSINRSIIKNNNIDNLLNVFQELIKCDYKDKFNTIPDFVQQWEKRASFTPSLVVKNLFDTGILIVKIISNAFQYKEFITPNISAKEMSIIRKKIEKYLKNRENHHHHYHSHHYPYHHHHHMLDKFMPF